MASLTPLLVSCIVIRPFDRALTSARCQSQTEMACDRGILAEGIGDLQEWEQSYVPSE